LREGGVFLSIDSWNENLSYPLADRIIVYSANLIKGWNLEKFSAKLIVGHEHFWISTNSMCTATFSSAKNSWLVGRLAIEKGAMKFAEAISIIAEKRPEFRFCLWDGIKEIQSKRIWKRRSLWKKFRS